MRTLITALAALTLCAAAPSREVPRPATMHPPSPGSDWLRGGAEPEAVFGPRRFAVPRRTLAAAGGDASVRGRTALQERIE